MMGDDKEVSKDLSTEKLRLKRSNAMFRECGPGGGYDAHVAKRMKESGHETIQHLTEYKPATDNNNKWRPHAIGSDESSVKESFNQCSTAKCNDNPVGNKVAPSAYMGVRRSAGMLKLSSSSSSSSSVENDVVTDGPRKKTKQKLSITPENYQSEAERLISFVGWPLNKTVHPEQLARVGFVYTGDGALVQCFQCGVRYSLWNEQDIPLNVHQICSPHCPFLLTLTGEDKSSSTEQRPPQPYTLPEPIGRPQFPYRSDQVARTRVKPFLQHSGTQDPAHRHVVAENWEGSDDDELSRHSPNHSLIASGTMCVAKLENTSRLLIHSNFHRSHEPNSTKCFRSPTHSLSGSPKTLRCSEQFAVKGCLLDTESGSCFSNIIHHSADYDSTEGAEQWMIIRSNTVVAGTYSTTMSRHDPSSLSSVTSTDLQSDIVVHSLDSEHISSGRMTMHSGDGIETTMPQTSSPSLRQNQLPSSSGSTSEPPNWRSLSSQQVSRKISNSDDESFYSVQSHVGTTLTSLDPAKATVMYEERLSEGPKNQHVPDVL